MFSFILLGLTHPDQRLGIECLSPFLGRWASTGDGSPRWPFRPPLSDQASFHSSCFRCLFLFRTEEAPVRNTQPFVLRVWREGAKNWRGARGTLVLEPKWHYGHGQNTRVRCARPRSEVSSLALRSCNPGTLGLGVYMDAFLSTCVSCPRGDAQS